MTRSQNDDQAPNDIPFFDDRLEEVFAATSSTEICLTDSGQLYGRSAVEIEALEADIDAQYERYLSWADFELFPSTDDERTDRDAVDAWQPDALRFACWRFKDGVIYLALEHQDREAAIRLIVGWMSQDDIDNSSA